MPGRQWRVSDQIPVGFTLNRGSEARVHKESAKCQKRTYIALSWPTGPRTKEGFEKLGFERLSAKAGSMPHSSPLITTVVVALSLAWVLGVVAHRLATRCVGLTLQPRSLQRLHKPRVETLHVLTLRSGPR